MPTSLLRPATAVALILAAATGCGGNGGMTATGSVTLDGQPVAGAEVTLLPKGGQNLSPHVATTDAGGGFTLAESGRSKTPVLPGTYKVLVRKTRVKEPAGGGMGGAVENELPAVYASEADTPLTVEIQAGNSKLPAIELKSKAAPAPPADGK